MKKIKQRHPRKMAEAMELARGYQRAGNYPAAEHIYGKILREQPNNAAACAGLAFVLSRRGAFDEAVEYYRKAVKLDPQLDEASYNLAIIFHQKGRLDEAVQYYRLALEVNPGLAPAYTNLGSILQQRGRFDEAIGLYQKAIRHNPGLISAYNNLGLAFQEKGLFDQAMESHRKALSLDPVHPAVHFNIGVLLLMHGDYEKGWEEYEWRKRMEGYRPRVFSKPSWDGTDPSGSRVLLHGERGYEGFGDTLQFVRYAPLLAKSGAKVIIECQEELKRLLGSVEGVERVFSPGEDLPEFDLHCPYLSLPAVFGTTVANIPSKTPYITADRDLVRKWSERIGQDGATRRIGIVWKGNLDHPRSRYRSCSLEEFRPLAEISGVALYSLQKGEHPAGDGLPQGMRLGDYTDEIADFADAAALIENLDLVISVDTAAAHLAGALGKTVWTLLPFVPEWRWMLDREDSPWYPTMKIFRQPSPGDWETVVSRVAEELRDKVLEVSS